MDETKKQKKKRIIRYENRSKKGRRRKDASGINAKI
jgi:hypothetical protein